MEEKREEVQSIIATVEKITYQNESNGYTVAQAISDKEPITIVGILPFLSEGDNAEFFGKYILHQTYGQQFSANCYERRIPQSAAGILRYLSMGAIKGIGPATAEKIVSHFKEDTLEIIQNNPKALTAISGISLAKAISFSEEYKKQYGVRDIMLFLSKYNVSPDRCFGIYKAFGDKSIEFIKANPYILCDEKIGFRFETAEEIAEDLEFPKDSEQRVSAGIEYVLRKNLVNGHTCLPRKKLISVSAKLLGCSEDIADICCDRLVDCMSLSCLFIGRVEFLALPEYFNAESQIAARLLSVSGHIDSTVKVDKLEIENVERQLKIEFEELQKQAIFEAFESGILVLTGGPGTGKTTTLNAIIRLFEGRGLNIELAAPTGRAAKRMTELCGREAKTIHRLLEVEWSDDEKRRFSRNEKNPLNCDVIIIDEASMIDSLLFKDLLKALKLSTRIILVGDSDQLPSIGAGNVLGDILDSDVFPSIRLKKVFRQAASSKIVQNAHAIINGEPADFSDKEADCFFMKRQDRHSTVNTVVELVCERLIAAYNIDPLADAQILCPSRMMDTGTVNLNNLLQERLNPHKKGKPQVFFKGFCLRVGDKVMQIKNNYDLEFVRDNGSYGSGVFNGDVGFVTEIDQKGGVLKVRFDDKIATYFQADFSQLELAYAVTVHKSQGSEYDYVILPLFDTPQKLKYRNLLYTAVTRAKKMLIVVGKTDIWEEMAINDRKTLRYTMLKHNLEKRF